MLLLQRGSRNPEPEGEASNEPTSSDLFISLVSFKVFWATLDGHSNCQSHRSNFQMCPNEHLRILKWCPMMPEAVKVTSSSAQTTEPRTLKFPPKVQYFCCTVFSQSKASPATACTLAGQPLVHCSHFYCDGDCISGKLRRCLEREKQFKG